MTFGSTVIFNYVLSGFRLALSGTFASEFHKFTMDWSKDSIKFYIDDNEIANYDPGNQGFYQYGEFDTESPGIDNPWKYSTNKMTPFDQEV